MRRLELRRHAPRDPEADRLSPEGERMAEELGATLEGPYDAIFVSPARRAAETAAWLLRGLNQTLPPTHGVAEGLAPPPHDGWVRAAEAAGSIRLDALERAAPELVATEGAVYGAEVRRLLDDVPEGGRGLAIGHTPMLEAAVHALTGTAIDPLRECEGALLIEDGGEVRLERELRREIRAPKG